MDIITLPSCTAIATSASPTRSETGRPNIQLPRSADPARVAAFVAESIDTFFASTPPDWTIHVTLKPPAWLRTWPDIKAWFHSLFPFFKWNYHNCMWFLQPDHGRISYRLLLAPGFDAHEGTALEAWSPLAASTREQKRAAMNPRLLAEAIRWDGLKAYAGLSDVDVAPVYKSAQIRDALSELATVKYPNSRSWGRTWWSGMTPCVTNEQIQKAWNLEEDYLVVGDPALMPEIGLSARYPRPHIPRYPLPTQLVPA